MEGYSIQLQCSVTDPHKNNFTPLTDPLPVALHSLFGSGSGPIGVSCALNAQTYGVQVTLADNNAVRREFAAERFCPAGQALPRLEKAHLVGEKPLWL